MHQSPLDPPAIQEKTDLVYGTVRTATVAGKDLKAVVKAAVAAQLGNLHSRWVKVRCFLTSQSTMSEGQRYEAKVTIAHRVQPAIEAVKR